jgi:hypothetical protein
MISDNSSVSMNELNTNFSDWIEITTSDGVSYIKSSFSSEKKAEDFINMLKAS